MNIKTLSAAITLSVLVGSYAQAETIGYGDITVGQSRAENPNDSTKNNATFWALKGAVATALGNNSFAFNAELREDGQDDEIMDDENAMDGQRQFDAHYFYDISGYKVGAFLAYAEASHSGDNENYKARLGGIQGIIPLTDDMTLYAQYGQAKSESKNQSSGGFVDGDMGRLGFAYSLPGSTLLKLEAEAANCKDYEDDGEDGIFRRYSVMGETSFGVDKNMAVTYALSTGKFDAKGDTDYVEEDIVSVGFRYYFGGATSAKALRSGLIGTSTLPARAMSWTPAMD